jgi:hypothetical protein
MKSTKKHCPQEGQCPASPALPLRSLSVSDHALLRFIERKHLLRRASVLDLDQLRADILPTCPKMLAAIDLLGDGEYTVQGSHRLRIASRIVVTVLALEKDDLPPRPKKAHHSNR